MIRLMKTSRRLAVGLIAAAALTACADLDVINPNQPDAARALAEAGDVESLMAGSFGQWWNQAHSVSGSSPLLANQSFMWSAWPANFGMVDYSGFPRIAVDNVATDQFYGNTVNYSWTQNYRALSAIAQGLQALEDPDVAGELGAARVARLRAFGRFVQGLAHGSIALLHDEGFVIDETTDVTALGDPLPYDQIMEAALGYFADAAALANQGGFESIPATWMTVSVSPAELARLAHSMRARYRANVARTPEERQAVDWDAVIQDVNLGVQDTWAMRTDYFGETASVSHYVAAYMSQPSIGWAQVTYFIMGMADQSGMYQDWIQDQPADRMPDFADGSPRLIITPDLRFPQGSTVEEQIENPGIAHVETGSPHVIIGHRDWRQPARGTFRWSYYRSSHMDFHRELGTSTSTPEVTMAEMRLLEAEGHYHRGRFDQAAELINVSREAAGLSPTDGQGTNDSCVPRLYDESCGGLKEMLKWEKRLETMVWGVHSVSWYFDGRGWGDLYEGTQTQFPVPCQERELLGQACNTYGGQPGAVGSAGPSVYNF